MITPLYGVPDETLRQLVVVSAYVSPALHQPQLSLTQTFGLKQQAFVTPEGQTEPESFIPFPS